MKRESGLNMNVLWVTAIALTALVALQLGRGGSAPFEQQALAEMVTSVGDYSIMTTDGGNEELLFVLDNRNEQLMVYKVDQLARSSTAYSPRPAASWAADKAYNHRCQSSHCRNSKRTSPST